MHRQSFSYSIALRARAKKIVILHSTESFGLRTHSDVREAIGARQMRKHLAITAHRLWCLRRALKHIPGQGARR